VSGDDPHAAGGSHEYADELHAHGADVVVSDLSQLVNQKSS
jgi:phosphoglycolate phosphatase-like HAD superfamily hydrolase